MREGLIRKALIWSPLSTLERVWSDECFFHLGHRSIAVLHGTAKKRRKLFENNAFDFYVVNHDGIDIISELVWRERRVRRTAGPAIPGIDQPENAVQHVLATANLIRDDIDLIIIDELGMFRNQTTNRWKVADKLIKPHMWVWGMTGTPIPQEPSDAYAEVKLVKPDRVPMYYTDFRHMTMQQLSEYIWIPKPEATKIVYEVMQPSIRYVRDQCFDLPPCTYSTREPPLSDEQKKHYKELAKQMYTEIAGGKVTALNEGVKMSKLIQCACGVVYDNEGKEREINSRPRIDTLIEIIEQCEHKVIVFVPNRAPLLMLQRELEKVFPGAVAVVHGNVAKGKRDTIFAEFQKLHNPRILLADAGCMSHGLTLTEASTIVWYGPEMSNDTYVQANGRITRSGQKNAQHIIHLASTEVERRIYARLRERGIMQGLLLDMVQRGIAL
jgi:SNF2 family DNA or RNA helicase